MKKYLSFTILSLILLGCESDKLDLLNIIIDQPDLKGSLSLKGAFVSIDETNKTPVPNCSSLVPTVVAITYSFEGKSEKKRLGIVINDNQFNSLGNLELIPGSYTITDINLETEDGMITHALPSIDGDIFPFSNFVNNPLPFEIEITPNNITTQTIETICYSSIDIDYLGGSNFSGEIMAFKPLILKSYFCDILTVKYRNYDITFTIEPDVLFILPVPNYDDVYLITIPTLGNELYQMWHLTYDSFFEGEHSLEITDFDEYGPDPWGPISIATLYTSEGYFDFNGDGEFTYEDALPIGPRCID